MKPLKYLLCFLAFGGAVLISFAPTLISTSTGQQVAKKYLSDKLPANLKIQDIKLSWFGPQKFKEIAFTNTKKGIDLACDGLIIKETLFSIALNGVLPSSVVVDNLTVNYSDAKGKIAPSIKEVIGDHFKLQLQSNPQDDRNRLIVHLQTPRLNAEFDGGFSWHERFLELPGRIQFTSPKDGSIENLKLIVSGNHINQFAVGLSGLISNQKSPLTKLFGTQVYFKVSSDFAFEKEGIAALPMTIALEGEQASLNLTGELIQKDQIQILSDIIFNYRIKALESAQRNWLKAVIPAPQSPISVKNWEPLSLSGQLFLIDSLSKKRPLHLADFDTTLRKSPQNIEGYQANLHLYNKDSFLKFEGALTDSLITLSQPLNVQLNPNSLLTQQEIITAFPILAEVASAQAPIKLTVLPEGAKIPLSPNLKNVQISNMEVNLGSIAFRNEGKFRQVARYFNSRGKEPLSIRFTPAYLSLQNGVINLARLDMLLMNAYPIVTWGGIDVIQDQLRLMLGIPTDALNLFFKLPLLNKRQMVTFPVVGPIGDPKVDTTNFQIKLAAFAAKSIAGTAGNIVGSTLQLTNGNGSIPPPTSTVPWADLLPSEKEEPKILDLPKEILPVNKLPKKAGQVIKKILPF